MEIMAAFVVFLAKAIPLMKQTSEIDCSTEIKLPLFVCCVEDKAGTVFVFEYEKHETFNCFHVVSKFQLPT